jgi:hypothetical protein
MKRLRKHLTFANVAAAAALFIALAGGTAYAASELGKESVDTKQLAKGAVTPSKLSKSSKKAMTGAKGATGATGPQGPIGLPGAPGTPGKEGPRGPGIEQIEHTATATLTTVRVVDGIAIKDHCTGTTGEIELATSPYTYTMQLFGLFESGGTLYPQDLENARSFSTGGSFLEFSARNTAVGNAYSVFNLRLSGCKLSGDVIPG